MAVLAFQLAGWAYQPPAGDQTCLGYLCVGVGLVRTLEVWLMASLGLSRGKAQTHGILGPPP